MTSLRHLCMATAGIAAPGLYLLFDRLMGLPLPLLGTWFG